MTTETILPVNREAVAERSSAAGEPEWMANLRLRALESASMLELPRLEKTRIDRWKLDDYGSYRKPEAVSSVDALPAYAKSLLGEDNERNPDNLLVQLDSGAAYKMVSESLTSQGVIFTDLETAVREHSDLVKKYFMQAVDVSQNRLTALHAALWNGGVFLYVPKNVNVEVPLQALFVSENSGSAFCPHVLIVAETGSSVTYVDNFVSGPAAGEKVVNGAVEVFVKAGAKVNFASIHNLGETFTDLSYRSAVVENDGEIRWILGELNSGNGMSDTTSLLKGNGSTSDAKVICVATGAQKLNLTTRAVHFGLSSTSDMSTRAVMRDEATAIVNGITKIEKGATGANGQQTEKVLMLSPKSRGDANPILLIDEDDVKAGHAASVGQVNPEQIFYLTSRGISKEEAQRLIIYGFLAPVVSEIPIKQLERQLQRLIERKLGQ